MALCPFLVEGQGIILQTNFRSPSPEFLLSSTGPWRAPAATGSAAGGGSSACSPAGRSRTQRVPSPRLTLLFRLCGFMQLLAKQSPSRPWGMASCLARPAVPFGDSSHAVSLRCTFSAGPLDPPLPQNDRLLRGHPVSPYLGESWPLLDASTFTV